MIILLLIPIAVGVTTLSLIVSGFFYRNLADLGSRRLVTENWESAKTILLNQQPAYERRYAYYQVKNGQTLESLSDYFSVNVEKLKVLNPGVIAAGTTIKVPPIEKPYQPTSGSNGLLSLASVIDEQGIIRVQHKYDKRQPITTTFPELTSFLSAYNALEQVGPTVYRINRPISLEGDIRLDVTADTVSRLELRSSPNDITCLCLDGSAVLIKDIEVTSFNPATGLPDTNYKDGRSFIRMKNGRMDIINSRFSDLGNSSTGLSKTSPLYPIQKDGGVSGVAWKIASDRLGQQITTGWIEGSSFERNYFGSYSFGSSGMVWKNNNFKRNSVHGLNLHDDSNNALIVDNTFLENGKHGIILSARSNYNMIRNNISLNNNGHGFMLYQDSAYNLIERNDALGNADNFVIHQSNFNSFVNNKSYLPASSHVRISSSSNSNYIVDNILYGGRRGIFLYDGIDNTYIAGNSIYQVDKKLETAGAQNTLLTDNTMDNINYDIAANDRMIFGYNKIVEERVNIPSPAMLLKEFNKHRALE